MANCLVSNPVRNSLKKMLHPIKQVLSAASSKFDGKDALEYAPWKKALTTEIADLQLNATQQLQLLEVRTDLDPQKIVKNIRYVKSDIGPERALQMAWENLDSRYKTNHTPSQQLMSTLIRGSTIKLADTASLFNLSMDCQSALAIRQTNPDSFS